MDLLFHVLVFGISALLIWLFAGMLIGAVDRVAHRLHASGFIVAFFVLGLLTSISEFSVAFNASLNQTPQVSAGNLVGASLVIFLLIIPLLAVFGKGVRLAHTLSYSNLFFALLVILLPALFVFDGFVSHFEGLLALFAYGLLIFLLFIQRRSATPFKSRGINQILPPGYRLRNDLIKIIFGALCIFLAAHFLVDQSVFFANFFGVPSSLIGLILLSVGTNVPELVIAIRSILQKHKDIAFGDYLGSAATNTLIFGLLAFANPAFFLERSEFILAAVILVSGVLAFFVFANSRHVISRKEGVILLCFYGFFLLAQVVTFVRFVFD